MRVQTTSRADAVLEREELRPRGWELFGLRNLCSDAQAQSQKEPSGASEGSGFSHQGHALIIILVITDARARFRGRRDAAVVALVVRRGAFFY